MMILAAAALFTNASFAQIDTMSKEKTVELCGAPMYAFKEIVSNAVTVKTNSL